MATKKRSAKAGSVGLWLGAFSLLESGQGEASFQIIAQARDADDAARVFEERLLHLRETTTLFEAEASLYLDVIIDLAAKSFPVPTLVNFVARKESSESDVWAPVPEQPDSRAEIYGRSDDDEDEKVVERRPFLEFAKRKPASKSKQAGKPAPAARKGAAKAKRAEKK